MSTSLLPAKWRTTPQGAAAADRFTALQRRNADLREKSGYALSPAALTLYTQGGALAAAAISAYVPKNRVNAAQWVAGLGAIVVGATMRRPDAVAAGNGILAIATYNAARERMFTRDSAGDDLAASAE